MYQSRVWKRLSLCPWAVQILSQFGTSKTFDSFGQKLYSTIILFLFTAYLLMLIGTKGWKVLDKDFWCHCLLFSLPSVPPISACPPWHNLFPSIAMLGRDVWFHRGASQGQVWSPGQENAIIWPKFKNLSIVMLECSPTLFIWRFPECQEVMGIRVPHVLSIPNQAWAHCMFSPFCSMTRTWKQSPWGKMLREGVDSRLSHIWTSFCNHNQKYTEKTLSGRKSPLGRAPTSVGTWTKQKTQHFVKGV